MAVRNVRISTVKAEREKPLLLETPSLVSSQTTGHVINECFSKLLASRDLPWDNKSVSNLALSKTGDRLRHNNRLAEDLKEVSDRYEKKLEAIRCLDQQVQRARAQALAREEQRLPADGVTERDSLVTIKSSYTGIDEQLLSQYKLLVPMDYLPRAQTPLQPPREIVPSYFRTTHTSQQHSRIQPVAYCHTLKTSPTKIGKHPAVWKQSMSPETRSAEKGTFSELQRKSNFLSSQRNASTTQVLTAKSKTKNQCAFAAQPSEVVFVDYQPGETYETIVDIHNVSGGSKQMRVVAPSSSYFTATLTYTPHPEGLIAPGMSTRYTIKFSPDSLCDFQDQLKVLTQNGESLCIPLKGSRQPPELNLPEVMDFGYCLADQERAMVFHCCNNGGEGTFTLMPAEEEAEKENDEGTCFLKPFFVTPSHFHLNRQESVDVHVTFHPTESGVFTRQLLISCDNGQVKSFKLSGEAEPLSVQCLSVSDSIQNKSESTNVLQFGLTNPGVPVYCTADVINTSHTDLRYQWRLYHPQTELGSGAVSRRVAIQPGDDTFTVDQWRGTLVPLQRTTFKFCFNPTKEGVIFNWCAYLQLDDVPRASLDTSQEGYEWVRVSEHEVAVVCLHMEGTSLPYIVQFTPPLCVLPGHLPPASTARQPFKMINHSLHAVRFHWRECSTSHYTITVEPSEGCIGADDSCDCVVVVETQCQQCELVEDLVCCLDHSKQLTLPIRAHIEGPSISLDEAGVDFGLVAVGGVSSRSLSITNHSPASAIVHLTQVVVESQEITTDCSVTTTGQYLPIMDMDCLQFSPSVLELSPHSSDVVSVQLGPVLTAGRLRTAIKCTTTGSTRHHVLKAQAEIQSPCVVLNESKQHISPAYTGIPVERAVRLVNTSLIPTHYKWVGQLHQQPGIQLEVSPREGEIGPRETVDLCLTMTFSNEGTHLNVVSGFTVDHMETPLLLMSVSADVFGLSVEYNIENEKHENGLLVVDFGSHNLVGQTCSKLVTVHNSSAIHTHCSAHVSLFPSAPPPPAAQHALSVYKKSQKKSLLKRTANLADPLSKSLQQAETTLSTGLLAHGNGACFTVEPCQFDLAPFQSQAVTITAYSDLWGQYTDTLHIEVDGLEEKIIPVSYGVDGCPIMFPSTATIGHTVVRMGCSCADSDPIKRTLRLSNESCADVCVHWQVYTVYPNDDKLVDLVTAFGDPFSSSSPPSSPSSTSSFPFSPRGSDVVESSPSITQDCDASDSGDGGIVKMYIRPHDGQLSNQPIAIDHERMVVSARSQTTVDTVFTPSVEAYNTLGSAIHCYMLGYLTLLEQSPAGCVRESGYDIPPLRVDVLARIEYPVLALETPTEDNTLTFTFPASSLIEDEVLVDCMVTEHRITLSNSSSTSVEFTVSCHTSSFSVQLGGRDKSAVHSLRPRQAIAGVFTACLKPDILQSSDGDSSGRICLTDSLTAVFSTGIKQEFPIVLKVILPQLEVSKSSVDYGVCFTGTQYTDHVLLCNTSQSGALWYAVTSPEMKGIVQVSPSNGWLPPHLSNGQPSMCEVTITFTPRGEQCYDGSVTFHSSPGEQELSVALTGVSSSDESVLN